MPSAEQTVRTYQELANHFEARGDAQMRDRFLILAAHSMLAGGRPAEAERVREKLLQLNPHHLLRPYKSFLEAVKATDVLNYIEGLRRTYPPDKATQMLDAARAAKPDPPPAQPTLKPQALPGGAPKNPIASPNPSPTAFRFQEESKSKSAGGQEHRPSAPGPRKPIDSQRPVSQTPAAGKAPVARVSGASESWTSPARSSWRDGPMEADKRDGGSWVAVTLFWLVLLLAAALAIYTVASPLLTV